MSNFLSQIRRSTKKRAILAVTGLLYVGYLGAVLFCHCLEGTSHNGGHHQAQAEQAAEHSHDSHHQSHDQSSTPHSCDCTEIESAVLFSSAVPVLVKYDYVVSLASEHFSSTALLVSPSLRFINSNHHGPPHQVPIHIKNQVFLI